MKLLMWLSFCLLFRAVFSFKTNVKTNQWPGRSVIVQMFEWKWLDIAAECERRGFLVPKDLELCRVYVDVVFNHMTGNARSSVGTGGSTADADDYSYPAVPYTEEHFNFPICQLQHNNNATEIRVCQLSGLHDLNQTKPYVRQKIIEYLNKLIDLGAAGIRVDAAKHMWPEDLNEIYKHLNNLNTKHGFRKNSRPYIYQEVSNGGVVTYADYKDMGDVTEFTVGSELTLIFSGRKPLKTLRLYGSKALNMMPSENALAFVDNHDTQRNGFTLNYKKSAIYKAALAFLLAYPYGQPRITSSYYFDDFEAGPPADSDGNIQSPIINEDQSCDGGWVCEHRWGSVYKMVTFRNEVYKTEVNNWWDNNNQVAFGLGNKGFIAFNTEGSQINGELQTGLPAGTYCDIISGQKEGNACTGKNVTVSNAGRASIPLSGVGDELYLAIHVGSESSLQVSQ